MDFNFSPVTSFLITLAVILLAGNAASGFFKKIKCPGVIGELTVGIILGPTLLGIYFPGFHKFLFYSGNNEHILSNFFNLAMIMLLLVAGMEVKLKSVLRYKNIVMSTTILGLLLPFIVGFSTAWFFPEIFSNSQDFIFSSFIGIALSISALPVIARILLDINILKTKIGTIIIASAVLTDIVGWFVFSLLMNLKKHQTLNSKIFISVIFSLSFIAITFIICKFVIKKLVPWFSKKNSTTKLLIPFCLSTTLLWAALTEMTNLHAALGAFLAGVILSEVLDTQPKIKEIIEQFIVAFFAPLFFVSVGLKADFIKDFNFLLVVIIFALAFVSKILGCGLGARFSGLPLKESFLVGFGLNARGAMEIILSTLALNAGIINSSLFVALVLMALLTTAITAPALKLLSHTLFLNRNDPIIKNEIPLT